MSMPVVRALVLLGCAALALVASALPAAGAVSIAAVPGTIAYIRPNNETGDEIWLIQPDGSNNRRIWSTGVPDPHGISAISDLDWRPDAGELAFASDHEFDCSIFDSDLYALWPNGSGYRRITNGPACGAMASFPKGNVSVSVRNYTTRGPFFVYIQGAPGVKMVIVPMGGRTTVTFTDVADFGDTLQQAVVIEGLYRWIAPIAAADVQPGQTVHAGTLSVVGDGYENYGAYVPSWHRSGTRLGYSFAAGAGAWGITATPPPGDRGASLINTQVFPNVLDWGPTAATTNQLLYYSYLDYGIYRVTEGSSNGGTRVVATEGYEWVFDLQWLPDASGFLFTKETYDENFVSSSNVYAYSFTTGRVTPLTSFSGEYARDVSASPDGQYIVFERSATKEFTSIDLWIMRRDGSDMQLLVPNAQLPSWSQRAPRIPMNLYAPLVRR